jgi:HEAT repeat protein
MTSAIFQKDPREWVKQLSSSEPNARALALAALVQQGAAATPALLEALAQGSVAVREAVARALAEISDPRTVDALAEMLQDTNPLVRGRGAQGMAHLNDARALDALVHTINDLPDVLHWPHTVATYLLIERGEAALPKVVPLLADAQAMTRQRALEVLQAVLIQSRGDAAWHELWDRLGRYDPQTDDSVRRAAAAREWALWVASSRSGVA